VIQRHKLFPKMLKTRLEKKPKEKKKIGQGEPKIFWDLAHKVAKKKGLGLPAAKSGDGRSGKRVR